MNLPWVYVHSAIYETIWCNGLPWIYGPLEEGWDQLTIDPCYTITPHKSAQGIYALSYM